jgi:mycoredoxin
MSGQQPLNSGMLGLHSASNPQPMEITVYTAFWCPDCRVAKRFLNEHGIRFTEIDIETTPGAADEVIRQTGKRAIPQLVIDGEWFQPYRPGEGFLYEEMAKRLGIAEPR